MRALKGTAGRRSRRRLGIVGVLLLCGLDAVAFQVPPCWWRASCARTARAPVGRATLAGLVGVVVLWQGLGAVFPDGGDALALVLRYLLFRRLGLAAAAPSAFAEVQLAGPSGSRRSQA